jgi:trans-aconitate 3-methyltransferase
MSSDTPQDSKPFVAESTFRSYSKEQGANYAEHRRNYHDSVYQSVVDYHTSTGNGEFGTLVDVGCGPGLATRSLAESFTHAIGIDLSQGMIDAARAIGGVSSNSDPIRFEVSGADDIGAGLSPSIANESVDVIIAATAAHWFDMPAFWRRAAQVLKPGGTVAVWGGGNLVIDPSVPNAAAIQSALDGFRCQLDEYMEEGNRLSADLYLGMKLPWTSEPPVTEFEESAFVRKVWNTGPRDEPINRFFAHNTPIDMPAVEMVLGTMSPVTRWRESHPETVGTEQDIVRKLRREFERLLHEAGVEEGKETLTGSVPGVMLLVKKRI